MKKLNLYFKAAILISAFFISSKNIYSQWTIVGDLAGLSPRPTVSVVDGNIAFVTGGLSGSNATYKTTNGGTDWIQLNTGAFNVFWSIWAKDANTVFAGANGNSSQDTAKLYKTTNGGNNWTVIASNVGEIPTFTGIKFSNSIPSFGIGVSGAPDGDFYIYKTRDGGNTWTRTLVTGFAGFNSSLGSLNVIDSLFYAHGTNGISSSLIITTDGGVTWNLRDLNLPSSGFSTTGIAFKEDKLTGIAGSLLPIIARTTNGGLNWASIDVGNGINSGAVVRMRWIEGTNTCYINATDATNGGILKSTNGGLNWTQMTTSGVGIYNFDTKRIGSNVYGYANSSAGGLVGGTQVLKVTDMVVGINQISELVPNGYHLSQNYPNPFNPVTVIRYSLIENSFTTLKVYDVLGNEVATLVNEKQNAGSYNYQLSTINYQLTSGVYFYKLVTNGFTDTKRMILLK